MRRCVLLLVAGLVAGCGGAGTGGGPQPDRESAAALGGLAARAQRDLSELGADLSAITDSGAGADDALVLQGGATSDAVERLRVLSADVEHGADGAAPTTRPAFLALGKATTAYLGVLQDLVVHQGSRSDLARYLCRVGERRDAVAGVRAAVTAFDADARDVRERTGVPVTQFGGDHSESLNDAYVTATYSAGCLGSAVEVLGAAVTAEVASTGPDATAASGAREVARLAGGVATVLGAAPPAGARPAIVRLWTATMRAARLEEQLWTVRANAYAAGREPSVAALQKRERVALAVWLAATSAV
jgi:hypothetical protein